MGKDHFSDDGVYLSDFTKSIAVECPRCQQQATVEGNGRVFDQAPAKVICPACGYNETQSENSWKGPMNGYVRRRCPRCGQWNEKRISGPRHPYSTELECPGCHFKFEEKIQWHKARYGQPHDPYFGLALWFQIEVSGEILWAYNRSHLTFLKNYVSAKLRQEVPNRNRSLVSRLPAWLKDRKNRSKVLKAIAKIEGRS